MLVGREKTPLARPAVNGGLIRRGLVVALLGSCLSPPAVATAASPSLTIAAYRAQASAICKTANRELNHHSPANFAGEVEFAFETARSAYAALARLKPPPRLAPLHAKMLVNTRALLADFPPLVKAAKKGMAAYERASAKEAAHHTKLGNEVAVLWTKLGVPACNQ
jgi:hypothetical protein